MSKTRTELRPNLQYQTAQHSAVRHQTAQYSACSLAQVVVYGALTSRNIITPEPMSPISFSSRKEIPEQELSPQLVEISTYRHAHKSGNRAIERQMCQQACRRRLIFEGSLLEHACSCSFFSCSFSIICHNQIDYRRELEMQVAAEEQVAGQRVERRTIL